MVIGNGLIANRFSSYQHDEDILIFASGVSDSKTTSAADFSRESTLLLKTLTKNKEKKVVYFSTCSAKDSSVNQSAYVTHKLAMEELVRKHAKRFTLFRLSNVVGLGGNRKTVFNYLFNQIEGDKHFVLWENSFRNILDIDDVYQIVHYILQQNINTREWNIAAPKSHNAMEIVMAIEHFLDKKASYTIAQKGSSYEIDIESTKAIIKELNINFHTDYLDRLLKKYYSNEL